MIQYLFDKLLSEKTRKRSERVIITIAIVSFIVHLIIFTLNELGFISIGNSSELFNSPIAAIYTPFSFILLYEVYLLVYYLPKSITLYISKQYEIMTLVVIRRIFKDLANLDLKSDWFTSTYDLQLTYDIISTLLLFALILLFYRLNSRITKKNDYTAEVSPTLERFIQRKKILAIILVPVFLSLAIYSFGNWFYNDLILHTMDSNAFGDINKIFFNEFFTILILSDVLLLLFSFFHTDQFSKIIRNSGFVISTILIRLSFGVEGITNNMLIVGAVIFGVLILALHN
ncbi:MAG: hypothetical protein WBM43_13125, partial [Flavobacteriaceae bacterium]